MPKRCMLLRVRGCTGNTSGISWLMSRNAPPMRVKVSASSTFDGRCSVITP